MQHVSKPLQAAVSKALLIALQKRMTDIQKACYEGDTRKAALVAGECAQLLASARDE